jgi:hypothetical protein
MNDSSVRVAGVRLLTLLDIVPALTHADLPPHKRMVFYDAQCYQYQVPEWSERPRPLQRKAHVRGPSGAGDVEGQEEGC